jgi:hypothetical protein
VQAAVISNYGKAEENLFTEVIALLQSKNIRLLSSIEAQLRLIIDEGGVI